MQRSLPVIRSGWRKLSGRLLADLSSFLKKTLLLLDNIAVHPDYQGRGIGRALLERADAEALFQGYDELRLYTHETMTENIALYTRSGWVETHRGHHAGYARVFMRNDCRPRPEENKELSKYPDIYR